MKALSIALIFVLSGCASLNSFLKEKPIPKTPAQVAQERWDALRPGATQAEVKDIAGEPSRVFIITAYGKLLKPGTPEFNLRNGPTQEYWFWSNGCSARFLRDTSLERELWDLLAETSCEGDSPMWSQIVEGRHYIEVIHFVGETKNFEATDRAKVYYYKLGRFDRCAVGISNKTMQVISRRCETDESSRTQAAAAQAQLEAARAQDASSRAIRSMEAEFQRTKVK